MSKTSLVFKQRSFLGYFCTALPLGEVACFIPTLIDVDSALFVQAGPAEFMSRVLRPNVPSLVCLFSNVCPFSHMLMRITRIRNPRYAKLISMPHHTANPYIQHESYDRLSLGLALPMYLRFPDLGTAVLTSLHGMLFALETNYLT